MSFLLFQAYFDLAVCQKTVGNLAGDFYEGGERKNTDILDSDGIKITNYPL